VSQFGAPPGLKSARDLSPEGHGQFRLGRAPLRQTVEQGSADATRMMAGEWWRAITALTLHAERAPPGQ